MSRRSPCERHDGATKNAYSSLHAAKKAARALQGRTGIKMATYKCPNGASHYHLTVPR